MTLAARLLCLLLGVGALLAACQPAQPASRSAQPAQPAQAAGPPASQPTRAAPAKLAIGKTGQGAEVQFWPVYVANAQGYFAQEGVDVELITVPAAYTATQALVGGDVQLVGFTVLSMAAAVVGGALLKLVASTQDLPSIRVVVQPEINSWADLKGKVISSGNTTGDYFDVVMRMVLAANGLHDGDYTMRTMPGAARLPALQTGQVAGALLSDYDANLALRDGFKSFGFVQDYVKDIQYSGYAVDDNWAKANDAALVGYLRGLLRATSWLFDPANRDEANRLFLAQGPELGSEQVERLYDQAITDKMLSRTLRPNLTGTESILKLAYQQGALPEIPPNDRWIDLSYLDRASR
ncbi:MAG TPA: ABC transporter substrate-binding protein [Chloroflexota bacterium]|nr:ABC transporter substrate-binding protein [Chloroflexota bacterium]